MMNNTQDSAILTLINPATEEYFAQFQLMKIDEIQNKVNKSQESFSKWKMTPLDSRIDIVQQVVHYFRDNKNRIAEDLTMQMGKPISQSLNEVDGAIYRMNGLIAISKRALITKVLSEVNIIL